MAAEWTFRVDSKQIEKKLTELGKATQDWSKPLDDLGKDLIDFYGNKVFSSQGFLATHRRWKPLSATTLKLRKERRGHYANTPIMTDKILIWTGRLKNSFYRQVDRLKLVIGNNAPYFMKHQLGEGNVPQRKIIEVNAEVNKIIMDKLGKYLEDIIRK